MILRHDVVFVLGAGASAPYGFPSGPRLAQIVCEHTENKGHPLSLQLREVFGDQLISSFANEFRRSGQDTLDAFVERRHEFQDVARAAIVQHLVPSEVDSLLLDRVQPERDWYKYLVKKIVPRAQQEFEKNRLKVITFNFDRSFERRLFLAVQSCYNLSPEDAARLCGAVPVLHMHGDLGAPSWMGIDNASPEDAPAREYRPDNGPSSGELLQRYAKRIGLITDSIPETRVKAAHEWLSNANVVCFLGFGYHPDNLRRLGVASLAKPIVIGTAMGIAEGEMTAVRREFNSNTKIDLCTGAAAEVRLFLADMKFIHD